MRERAGLGCSFAWASVPSADKQHGHGSCSIAWEDGGHVHTLAAVTVLSHGGWRRKTHMLFSTTTVLSPSLTCRPSPPGSGCQCARGRP
eukprot:7382712-Prymnesium_polylepis.1